MIRVAIVGLGAAVRNIHLPAYARLGDMVRVVGGCDPDAAARAAAQSRVAEVFDDPARMIEVTKPDVVSIVTPPSLHLEQCLLALRNGCHVFCEKPLADDLGQIDEIIRASEDAGRHVVVNTQFPFMNTFAASKRLVDSDRFGRLLFLRALQTSHPTERTERDWRSHLRRRLCFEFGVHVFSLVRFFFDEDPVKVCAHMPNPSPRTSSETIDVISLEFGDGRGASIVLDRLSRGPERYLDVALDGERAAIHASIGGELRFEAGLHTRERRPFVGVHFAGGGRALLQNGTKATVVARDPQNPFASATAAHFRQFADAIRTGGRPAHSAVENRRVMAMVFAAYDAAELGKTIDLAPYLIAPYTPAASRRA